MFLKKYNSIMAGSEAHRNRWALGLSLTLSLLIFTSFAFYRGFLTFGNDFVTPKQQVANVVSAERAPTPVQNTKETFKAAFGEINKQYKKFTDSLSSVLVPFVSSIEVYERK